MISLIANFDMKALTQDYFWVLINTGREELVKDIVAGKYHLIAVLSEQHSTPLIFHFKDPITQEALQMIIEQSASSAFIGFHTLESVQRPTITSSILSDEDYKKYRDWVIQMKEIANTADDHKES